MYKIICTGNPKGIGIAQEIKKLYPDTFFVSRETGFDLSTSEGFAEFKKIIPNYNVLINSSFIYAGFQKELLEYTSSIWNKGNFFNIGSIDEYKKFGGENNEWYQVSNDLKETALFLTDENFKVTHITVGGFQSYVKSGSEPTMHPRHIAETIKWILNAEFEVPVIGMQQMSQYIRDYYNV